MMTFKEYLATPLLEGREDEILATLLPLLLIEETTDTSNFGGWAPGPFRPGGTGMNGNHWFGEFYTTVKNLAIATKMSARMKELGLKGAGVDRVKQAAKTAAAKARDLLANPQKTAYRIPAWTTDTPKKVKIKVWNEEFSKEFEKQLKAIK